MHALTVFSIVHGPLMVAAVVAAIQARHRGGWRVGTFTLVTGVALATLLGYAAAGVAVISFGAVR